MPTNFTKLVLAGTLLLLVLPSCYKLSLAPPPGFLQHEEFPLMSYLDSIETLNIATDSSGVVLSVAGINPMNPKAPDTTVGQAISAFAFRTSVPGFVNALGVYVPEAGYTHTATLWDSVTGDVLAQANVSNSSAGWAFIDLPPASYVQLQPNHGYIIGYNSAAIGAPLNSNDPGNYMYRVMGLYDFKVPVPEGALVPLFPMIYKSFTIEGSYLVAYGPPFTAPIFPVGNADGGTNAFFGACDIGFYSE